MGLPRHLVDRIASEAAAKKSAEVAQSAVSEETLREYRGALAKSLEMVFTTMDNWFLTLSGAGIGLLAAAATGEKLVTLAVAEKNLLICAGGGFGASLACAMMAKGVTWLHLESRIDALDARTIDIGPNAVLEDWNSPKWRKWHLAMRILNFACFATFMSALVSVFAFVCCRFA